MDKNQHLFEAFIQLRNNKHYLPLSQSIQNVTKTKIQSILAQLLKEKHTNQRQFTGLSGPDCSKSFISCLKYIKKSTNIDTPSGLEAEQRAFKKYTEPEQPEKDLLQLLELSLNRF